MALGQPLSVCGLSEIGSLRAKWPKSCKGHMLLTYLDVSRLSALTKNLRKHKIPFHIRWKHKNSEWGFGGNTKFRCKFSWKRKNPNRVLRKHESARRLR